MTDRPDDNGPGNGDDDRPASGPRGGTSTVNPTGDMVRKGFWIDAELEAHLRKEAFETRVSEAEIIRRLLRNHYSIN